MRWVRHTACVLKKLERKFCTEAPKTEIVLEEVELEEVDWSIRNQNRWWTGVFATRTGCGLEYSQPEQRRRERGDLNLPENS